MTGVALVTLMVAVAAPAAGAVTAVRPLEFGIYPGGYAGGGSVDPVPDDPVKITHALDGLQAGPGFLVREYIDYDGKATTGDQAAKYVRYLGHGRRFDLVLDYPGDNAPLDGWLEYVRNEVRLAGPFSADISLGVDVNLNASKDPSVVPAVVRGVIAAKDEARRLDYHWLRIGFDEVPFGRPDLPFWQSVARAGGDPLRDSIDYVGVELYPDVFAPAPNDRGAQVTDMLATVREQELPAAGISPRVPIHVSENGWDTVGDRTEATQVDALEAELGAVNANRARFNVTTYEFFDLRDDRTDTANLFDHFGLLHDDYTPKPAFDVYRRLVRSLG
jgi:hypothetical protein